MSAQPAEGSRYQTSTSRTSRLLGSFDGLDAEAVRARVASGRVNAVKSVSSRTFRQILRSNLFTRFNAILGILLVVILSVGPPLDALFGAVLVVNA